MGILDEAIREHLELKRQHGAEGPELQKLEDEALGPPGGGGELEEPPEMSDADAEAPTDYIGSPAAAPSAPEEDGAADAPESEDAASEPEATTPAPDLRPPEMRPEEPPPSVAESKAGEAAAEQRAEAPPAEEEDPAMEHEVPEPAAPDSAPETSAEPPEPPPVDAGGVSAELRAEREEIAQHPTEHYDVEEEIAEAEKEAAGFFNEQSLSDELDQALDSPDAAPPTEEGDVADPPDEVEVIEEAEEAAALEEPDAIEADEIAEVEEAEEAEAVEEAEKAEAVEEAEQAEPATEEEPAVQDEQGDAASAEEDVLEETPDFLQDSPEHDRLWFEQKPPKDFDFDD